MGLIRGTLVNNEDSENMPSVTVTVYTQASRAPHVSPSRYLTYRSDLPSSNDNV